LVATPALSPPAMNAPINLLPTNLQNNRFILAVAAPIGPNAGTRGRSKKGQTVEKALLFLSNHTTGFEALKTGGELRNQSTYVFDEIFQRSHRQDKLKIEKVMMLVDCLWTSEERNVFVHKLKEGNDLIQLALKIQKCVIDAAHVLKKDQTKATSQRGRGGILGIANNIGVFDMEPYLPDWTKEGATQSNTTLAIIVEQRRLEINNLNNNI
jgi:hypothetical protein